MNKLFTYLLVRAALTLAGCTTDIQVTHAPLVARTSDPISFTAPAVTNTTPDSIEIQLPTMSPRALR